MTAKRHMDIERNITGHNIIIADITRYSLKKFLFCSAVLAVSNKMNCKLYERYRLVVLQGKLCLPKYQS